MRRAVKISAGILACAAATLVLLIAAAWIAGNTDPGRTLIERLTYQLTSGQVRLSGLGGSFPTEPSLRELQLSDRQGVWLTADDLTLRWSPLKLLLRRIQADDLRLTRLHVERAPIGDEKNASTATPSIPHIDVAHFAVAAVELGAPLVGTPATLAMSGTLHLRSLEDADADVTARRLDGDGEYALRAKFDRKRMDASLTVREPVSGPLENLLSVPGLGALSATMTLQGPRAAERVDVEIDAGNLHAQVHGSLDLPHASADLDFALEGAAVAPRPDLSWDHASLAGKWHGSLSAPSAEGRLSLQGLRVAGDTRVRGVTAELKTSDGKLLVHTVIDGLEIPGPEPRLFANDALSVDAAWLLSKKLRPLDVTATHRLFVLRARTETATLSAAEQRATIELTLPEVAPFAALAGQDAHGKAAINAGLTHGFRESGAELSANAELTGGTAAWIPILGSRLALKGAGTFTDGVIKLQNMRLTTNSLTLTANGSMVRSARAAADLQARWQLEMPDLAVLSSDLAGDLKASGQLRGALPALLSDIELTSRLSVRGSPAGTVQAVLHARGLPGAPSGTLQAHGMVDDAPLNLDAALERSGPKVFRLWVRRAEWKSAHVDGDLTADAALTQSHGQLRLHVARLEDLDHLLGTSVTGGVEGSLELVPAQGRTEARVKLNGTHVAVGRLAGDVHVEAAGAVEAVAVQLSAQVPDFYGTPASISGAGTLNASARQLQIATLVINYRGQALRLLSPAQLSFADGVAVDDVKIGARNAVFNLRGRLAPTFDFRASLRKVDPDLVNAFAPDLLASGSLDVRVRLQGDPSSLTGDVRLDARDVRFADDAATGLPATNLHAEAQLTGAAASISGALTAGATSKITVSGTAPLNANGAYDLKIGGNLDTGLANPLLEARGLHAAGVLAVAATVTGPWGAPQVGGGISLTKGSVRDYAHGVNLSDIDAEVAGNEQGLVIKSFTATAVSGSVAMTGSCGVLQPGMPIDLKITAKNAQPVATNIITANLDADLHVGGTLRERIDVAGTVHVNRATVGIPNSLPPDVAVLDVHRRGKPAPLPGGKQLIVGIDVAIRAPQEILVQGRGLDAELGGEIHLTGTSDELLASGGFDLQRGRFTLAGTTLDFTQGRVGFDGAGLRKKIDPTLDFTAQTTLTDTTVRLNITGFADAPRFEFSSSTGLAQDEIMARLLFGENAAQLSALQLAQIGAALATLSGVGDGGLNPLAKLQKTLGLDRLTVGTNTTTTATGTENSGAAIAAGRYVSKRVYIEGKQTTAGTSQVQVDVELTKRLKLQTRLGNGTATTQGTTPDNDPGSSVGLSYQFEY